METNKTRYRTLLGCGWLLPFGFTIMTALTEAFAPECASLKPSFGEGVDTRCFFATGPAQTFWFFIPIMIFLIINAILFFISCHKIYKDDSMDLINPLHEDQHHGENEDTVNHYMNFLKLLGGLSFIWILHLVAGFNPNVAWSW